MADDRAGLDPELQRLADRFSGCLLGAMLGDVLGKRLPDLGPVAVELKDVRKFTEGSETPEPFTVEQRLGNGVAVLESWPSALVSFMVNHRSFREAVWFAIRLGGDTDTIAAMTGALSGALLGEKAFPARWLAGVKEPEECGVALARTLARQLALCTVLHHGAGKARGSARGPTSSA